MKSAVQFYDDFDYDAPAVVNYCRVCGSEIDTDEYMDVTICEQCEHDKISKEENQ